MFKVLDDILLVLKQILAALEKDSPISPPIIQPKTPPGPTLYPCQPTPPVHHDPIPNTQSLVFTEPYRRHEVYLRAGELVRMSLDAPGRWGATFTIYTTSKDQHIYGPNPRIDRWVDDDTGKVYIREEDMGLNAGSMRAEGPFTRRVYLNIYPQDFTGLVFVEYQ